MESEKRIYDRLISGRLYTLFDRPLIPRLRRQLTHSPWADALFTVRKPTPPSQDIRLARRFVRFQDLVTSLAH